MTNFHALSASLNAVWAMEEAALANLLTIAAREHDATPQALEAYRAKALANGEQATVRNGVAIIAATGPLFKRANIMTAISGATSYEIMLRDLRAALDDPKVKAVLLNIDSPGGEASGAHELAQAIYEARSVKPITAYVNGMAASAGYWIASAASEVVVDATALLGSIGVQMAMRTSEDPKGTTTYRFVSSQSPMKNADPGTEAGAAHIQGVVDAMAKVFVEAVATHRGRSIETVLSDFGKGGIFVGQHAIKAGLADRIGNFEGVLAELSAGCTPQKGPTMTNSYANPVLDAAIARGIAAANARTAQITELGANLGASAAEISAAIIAGTDAAAFAVELSRKHTARSGQAQRVAPLSEEEEVDAMVQAILNCDDPDFNDPRRRSKLSAAAQAEEDEIEAIAARIAAA